MPQPVVLAWSGGKDSAMALARLQADPAFRPVALLTTVSAAYDRVSIHGVRRELLRAQARAVGIPLTEAVLPPDPSNAIYEEVFSRALNQLRTEIAGLAHVAFGDLFLADIRAYRERQMAELGLTPLFPVWGQPTAELARLMIRDGYRATVVAVDLARLPGSFAGRPFDLSLLADLPTDVDPCGENGEFHTFAFDGPIFRQPVPAHLGQVVVRDGVAYADLQ